VQYPNINVYVFNVFIYVYKVIFHVHERNAQVVNFSVLLRTIYKKFEYAFVGNEGFEVKDADDGGKVCRKWLSIAAGAEDSRGLRYPLSCSQGGATVGACPFCHVVGRMAHGNMRYLTYVILLAANDPLRAEFQKEYAGWPDFLEAGKVTPTPMTLKKALAICKEAEALVAEANRIGEGNRGYPAIQARISALAFRGYNAFTTFFGEDYDFIKRMNNDLAHAIKNLIGDIIRLLGNTGSMKYTPKKHKQETAHGRFRGLRYLLLITSNITLNT
jgi:hypothetical protein